MRIIIIFMIFSAAMLNSHYCSAQIQMNISSKPKDTIFNIDLPAPLSGNTLVLTFQNDIAEREQQKDTFLCFVVTQDHYDIQENQMLGLDPLTKTDLENCQLQATQIISIDLNDSFSKVFIQPIFINQYQTISSAIKLDIETLMSAQYIPTVQKCNKMCNGGTCLASIYTDFLCDTCPDNLTGARCGQMVQTIEGDQSQDVILRAKDWNFFQAKILVNSPIDDFHFLIMNKNKKQNQIQYNVYWNYQLRVQGNQRDDSVVPNFSFSLKRENVLVVDDIIPKELIQNVINDKYSKQTDSLSGITAYPIIFLIGIYNDDNTDKEAIIEIADDATYKKLVQNFLDVFDLPVWVFYLMMGFAVIFFIAILCLVRALIRKYQEEQQMRLHGIHRPHEKLTPEIVDELIPKYTFKHIFKAVKKRKKEVLKHSTILPTTELGKEEQAKQEAEQEEIYRKVQERCESILSNGECGICLCNFEFEEECRLTICDHIFHVACFDPWLYKNQNCPYCRTALNEAALQQWKETTKQHYPLDQSLNSFRTLDSIKISKQEDQAAGQERQAVENQKIKVVNDNIFSADLVIPNPQTQNIPAPINLKPIYFHSLSLQSLQEKSKSTDTNSNSRSGKNVKIFNFLNGLNTSSNNNKNNNNTNNNEKTKTKHSIKQKTMNAFDDIQEEKYDGERKNLRASTLKPIDLQGAKHTYSYEPKSAQIAKLNQEICITTLTNSPDGLTAQKYTPNGYDFKHINNNHNHHDGELSEASTRLRNDSHALSLLGEGFSHNKLFNGHESSSKLAQSSNIYNYNLQDSVIKSSDRNFSPRQDYNKNDKPSKVSQFSKQNVISSAYQEDSIYINEDYHDDHEKQGTEEKNKQYSPFKKTQINDNIEEKIFQLNKIPNLAKHISADDQQNHIHFNSKDAQDEEYSNDGKVTRSKTGKSNTITLAMLNKTKNKQNFKEIQSQDINKNNIKFTKKIISDDN